MNILLDENIPGAEHHFSSLGTLRKIAGRQITAAQLADTDVLLVRSVTPVDSELLQNSSVRFVGSCTSGIDHIDRAYLSAAGIGFAHAPGANAYSVVEYVLSALCSLSRRYDRVSPAMSVGIVGLGHVGEALYRVLEACGFSCRGHDPLRADAAAFANLCSLEEALAADIVTLHTPLTREGPNATFQLLDAARLHNLAAGSVLINSARGDVVDNQALKSLLQQRKDIAVVLDVWQGEPAIDRDLLQLVDLATPHIAGYSYEGKLRGTAMVHRALCDYLGMGESAPTVDMAEREPIQHMRNWHELCERMLATYNVEDDDARMREAISASRDRGQAFEELRRNYPRRHEVGLPGQSVRA